MSELHCERRGERGYREVRQGGLEADHGSGRECVADEAIEVRRTSQGIFFEKAYRHMGAPDKQQHEREQPLAVVRKNIETLGAFHLCF